MCFTVAVGCDAVKSGSHRRRSGTTGLGIRGKEPPFWAREAKGLLKIAIGDKLGLKMEGQGGFLHLSAIR